jgi:hypothetical protein
LKLLTEVNRQLKYLTEETSLGKKTFIEGVFATANEINKNRRIYPMRILESEISRYREESINNGTAVGELSHPAVNSTGINPDRIAISIKSIKQIGNHFIGKAMVVDTPVGRILEGLMSSGIKLGISTRGTGTTRPIGENVNEVEPGYHICSFDVVCAPSTDSYVTSMTEQLSEERIHEVIPGSVEHTIKNKVLNEQINYIRSHSKGSNYRARIGRMK